MVLPSFSSKESGVEATSEVLGIDSKRGFMTQKRHWENLGFTPLLIEQTVGNLKRVVLCSDKTKQIFASFVAIPAAVTLIKSAHRA